MTDVTLRYGLGNLVICVQSEPGFPSTTDAVQNDVVIMIKFCKQIEVCRVPWARQRLY